MNKPIECLLHRDRALLAEYANVCLESLPDKCNAWSSTYRGLHKGRSICVKVWRGEGLVLPSQERTGFFRKLEREVLAWQVLSHPNIGAVHGLLFTLNNLPSVVTPYYPNGDINSYVSNNPCIDLKALVLGVATGLRFLHHLNPPISHGDVRGCNVFITDDGVPVLSEIGLSLLPTPPDWTIPSDDGTRWMAPEVMDPRSISSSNFDCLTTPMSDVYSFGMMMLEVYTGKVPFYTRRFYGRVVLDIMRGMRPSRPKVEACASLTDEIWHTIESCWAQDPLQRPTTESITSWLQLIIRSESAEYL
ncbi:kinase-like protein [Lentinula edodes]|uniref:Kinase-like protein n=1 Tax=Lentinula edodes TaxID=5353 RepID=A0A1Q3ECM4_LENED|nr:kinase-like protein [Lentinula edodes]